ncbi:unnamed protein product [Closterium sp. Naga37s-1]|nr:unnamed protein product [Closterium sp. Naga37s-1]
MSPSEADPYSSLQSRHAQMSPTTSPPNHRRSHSSGTFLWGGGMMGGGLGLPPTSPRTSGFGAGGAGFAGSVAHLPPLSPRAGGKGGGGGAFPLPNLIGRSKTTGGSCVRVPAGVPLADVASLPRSRTNYAAMGEGGGGGGGGAGGGGRGGVGREARAGGGGGNLPSLNRGKGTGGGGGGIFRSASSGNMAGMGQSGGGMGVSGAGMGFTPTMGTVLDAGMRGTGVPRSASSGNMAGMGQGGAGMGFTPTMGTVLDPARGVGGVPRSASSGNMAGNIGGSMGGSMGGSTGGSMGGSMGGSTGGSMGFTPTMGTVLGSAGVPRSASSGNMGGRGASGAGMGGTGAGMGGSGGGTRLSGLGLGSPGAHKGGAHRRTSSVSSGGAAGGFATSSASASGMQQQHGHSQSSHTSPSSSSSGVMGRHRRSASTSYQPDSTTTTNLPDVSKLKGFRTPRIVLPHHDSISPATSPHSTSPRGSSSSLAPGDTSLKSPYTSPPNASPRGTPPSPSYRLPPHNPSEYYRLASPAGGWMGGAWGRGEGEQEEEEGEEGGEGEEEGEEEDWGRYMGGEAYEVNEKGEVEEGEAGSAGAGGEAGRTAEKAANVEEGGERTTREQGNVTKEAAAAAQGKGAVVVPVQAAAGEAARKEPAGATQVVTTQGIKQGKADVKSSVQAGAAAAGGGGTADARTMVQVGAGEAAMKETAAAGGGGKSDVKALVQAALSEWRRKEEAAMQQQAASVLGRGLSDVRKVYQLGKELGRGNFGVIREAVDWVSGERFACKSVNKKRLESGGALVWGSSGLGELWSGGALVWGSLKREIERVLQKNKPFIPAHSLLSLARHVPPTCQCLDELDDLRREVECLGDLEGLRREVECLDDLEDLRREVECLDDLEDLRREVEVMRLLKGHPNIVSLVDTYEDDTDVHIVMELCEGGELFDRIVARNHFSERQAAQVCRTLADVLRYCHSHHILHRDLKPENVLLVSTRSDTRVKVIDFGMAYRFQDGERCTQRAGTPNYISPEVIAKNYGTEADVWSLGVILYVMLCGLPPFWGDTTEEIFSSILYEPLDLETEPWPDVSAAAKDLVRRMLCRRFDERITVPEILSELALACVVGARGDTSRAVCVAAHSPFIHQCFLCV